MTARYIIFLVDSPSMADKINREVLDTQHENTKIQAIASGMAMVGLHHRGTRPTLIIDMMRDRTRKGFDDWYEKCVLPSAVNADIIREAELWEKH